MTETEGLIARIREISRRRPPAERRSPSTLPSNDQRLGALEERVSHLEQLLEGLQDAVHRQALRHDKRVGDLETRTEPGELSKALSKDARERGL